MDATLHAKQYVSVRVWAVTVPPVVFQCRLQKLEFFQWHPSVGRIQLSFSSGVPVYPASIRWVAQRCPSVHWVNQWHSSDIQGKGGVTMKIICVRHVQSWTSKGFFEIKNIAKHFYFVIHQTFVIYETNNAYANIYLIELVIKHILWHRFSTWVSEPHGAGFAMARQNEDLFRHILFSYIIVCIHACICVDMCSQIWT